MRESYCQVDDSFSEPVESINEPLAAKVPHLWRNCEWPNHYDCVPFEIVNLPNLRHRPRTMET